MPSRWAISITATISSGVLREDHAHGLHLVDAGVGAVEGAGKVVKAHFPGYPTLQLSGEFSGEGDVGLGCEGHGRRISGAIVQGIRGTLTWERIGRGGGGMQGSGFSSVLPG